MAHIHSAVAARIATTIHYQEGVHKYEVPAQSVHLYREQATD